MNKGEIKERVEKALDFVGLLHKKNQNALSLSSGEAKRDFLLFLKDYKIC